MVSLNVDDVEPHGTSSEKKVTGSQAAKQSDCEPSSSGRPKSTPCVEAPLRSVHSEFSFSGDRASQIHGETKRGVSPGPSAEARCQLFVWSSGRVALVLSDLEVEESAIGTGATARCSLTAPLAGSVGSSFR